jgi:hypothetical protein
MARTCSGVRQALFRPDLPSLLGMKKLRSTTSPLPNAVTKLATSHRSSGEAPSSLAAAWPRAGATIFGYAATRRLAMSAASLPATYRNPAAEADSASAGFPAVAGRSGTNDWTRVLFGRRRASAHHRRHRMCVTPAFAARYSFHPAYAIHETGFTRASSRPRCRRHTRDKVVPCASFDFGSPSEPASRPGRHEIETSVPTRPRTRRHAPCTQPRLGRSFRLLRRSSQSR